MSAHPTLADFDWPCDRRDAHHPHTIREESCAHYPRHKPEHCHRPVPGEECPGVDAHPLTQIGGNYR